MKQAIELLPEIASGQAQKEGWELQIGRQIVYWRIWMLVTELLKLKTPLPGSKEDETDDADEGPQ